jgi:hypothetical protein
MAMRMALAAAMICWCSTSVLAGIQSDDGPSKSLCIIEKAAGVLLDERSDTTVPKAVRFDERHNHFILTIKRIVRSESQREWCLKTLAHWTPILRERGTFEPDDKWSGRPYDLRSNIGRCFASNEATIKYFDRNGEEKMESHDFLPMEFVGLAGNWLKKIGDRFQAGSTLDSGPVVFSGTCKAID